MSGRLCAPRAQSNIVCSRRLSDRGGRPLKLTVRPRMKYLIGATALALLILGPLAFVSNRRANRISSAPTATWLRWYRFHWVLAASLGIAALLFHYSTFGHDGQPWRVYGFPFPAAAFDSRGADYAGLVTLPFTLFNLVIWTSLPDVALFVWRRAIKNRSETLRA